jgi:hypothetical protein
MVWCFRLNAAGKEYVDRRSDQVAREQLHGRVRVTRRER